MKQARTLSEARLKQALAATKDDRERAMLLLSCKAGLRACEIAGLQWDQVDFAERCLRLVNTKGDKPRTVPMHPALVVALMQLEKHRETVFVNRHATPGARLTANAVAVWLRDFYTKKMGWEGYSSHSGRRTFTTNAARKVGEVGGSLKDVMELVGHAKLETTQRYVDTDPEAQKKLVDLI